MAQNQQTKQGGGAGSPQLEAIIEAIADSVVVYDDSGAILWANAAARELVKRITPPDLQSLSPYKIPALLRPRDIHGKELPSGQRILSRALRGERLTGANAIDISLPGGQGETVFINVSAAPIRDEAEQITGAVCIYRDVTARRQLEERTHDALMALVNLAQVIVQPELETSLAHAAAKVGPIAATRAMPRRLGALALDVLGCSRFVMVAASSPDEPVRPLASRSSTEKGRQDWWAAAQAGVTMREALGPLLAERLYAGELLVLDYRDPPFSERANPYGLTTFLVAPLHIGNRVIGTLATDYNGEEHVYTHEEIALTRAVAQLGALVVERENLLKERQESRSREESLRETNQHMDEFVSVASHELRTPLTTLKLFVDLMNRRVERPPSTDQMATPLLDPQLLRLMTRQVTRLEHLVGDLLDTSAIQAGRLALRLRPIDLASVIRDSCDERKLTTQGHAIECRIPRRTFSVIADSERIGQVLTNFLTNAIKYTPEQSSVVVQLRRRGDWARISVTDQGPGIPRESLRHIFERFYRVPGANTQNEAVGGMGLGLFISKTIIERHGGRIGVTSAIGKGSTFWFTLPLAPGEQEQIRDRR